MSTSKALTRTLRNPLKGKIKHLITLTFALQQLVGEDGNLNMIDNHYTNQLGKHTDEKQAAHDQMIQELIEKIEETEKAAKEAKIAFSYSNAYAKGYRYPSTSKSRRAKSVSIPRGRSRSRGSRKRSV